MTALALSRGDLLRALAVVVIWGLNFVVMKLGLQGLSPMLLGALRFTAASLPFLLFVPRPALPWRFVVGYGLAQGLGEMGAPSSSLRAWRAASLHSAAARRASAWAGPGKGSPGTQRTPCATSQSRW